MIAVTKQALDQITLPGAASKALAATLQMKLDMVD
jgi:hypothetical protein